MPFNGENASKTAHNDIRNNPDIIKFLEECPDIPRPEAENIEELLPKDEDSDFFQRCQNAKIPKYILSLDGSNYEAIIDKRYPSRKIGYIKISVVVLEMEHYNDISSTAKTRYVNPMEVAKLQKDTTCLSFALPGSYVQKPGDVSPYETFRKTLLESFQSNQYKLDNKTLLDTLFELSLKINKAVIDNNSRFFKIDKCPTRACHTVDTYMVPFNDGYAICPHCNNKIFATDVLRVHEPFSNSGDNTGAYSRTRNILEHIVLFHYLKYIWETDLQFLSEIGVILDGPLAIFGEGAKYHGALMQMYDDMKNDCKKYGYKTPIIIGLTKTGRVVEHFMSIKNMLPEKVIFPINDNYRYSFINEQDDSEDKHFGIETYYGQDFLVKTAINRQFVICISYPFSSKTGGFHEQKTQMNLYTNLESIVKLVMTFETDMYENGLMPIILAHKHASISLKPGGKMLDILSRKYFTD
jgi:hypothetical protein